MFGGHESPHKLMSTKIHADVSGKVRFGLGFANPLVRKWGRVPSRLRMLSIWGYVLYTAMLLNFARSPGSGLVKTGAGKPSRRAW